MTFKQNQECAFAVVTKRNTGDGVPKVTKIVGDLHTCPEQALSARNAMNHDSIVAGDNTPYIAVSVDLSFIREISETDFDDDMTLSDNGYNTDRHDEFVERISDMDAFDLLELILGEESVRQSPKAIEAIRQRDRELASEL